MRNPVVLSAAKDLLFVVTLSLFALPLHAQLVTPKTVPVFQDEQFALYPTSRPGMSGVSIALDDTLGDPFSNPAKASRLRGLMLTSSPYSHTISGERGGGRTIPAGVMYGSTAWSGFALAAMQEIDRTGPVWNLGTSERKGANQYYTGGLARRFLNGISVGVSAYHADLEAVDGVDLLYPGSDRITQSGSLNDYRVGLTKEWAQGHVAELVLLRNSTKMRHDVHFTTWTWDPARQTGSQSQRTDVNLDETNIIGAHTSYVRPFGEEGWRIGVVGTANRLDHPKIPNYVLQSIPRDPGSTNAFNVGVGVGRETGLFSLAADVVLEPMSSDTWADQATDVKRSDGSVIKAGERTVENHFTFRNSRAGIVGGRRFVTDTVSGTAFTLNFGLSVRSISYDLKQQNNITRVSRRQHEHWLESGPSLGFRFQTRDIEFSYAFRAICGSGDCVQSFDRVTLADAASSSVPTVGGIIAAPNSPLFLQSGKETSHHFTVTIPIR